MHTLARCARRQQREKLHSLARALVSCASTHSRVCLTGPVVLHLHACASRVCVSTQVLTIGTEVKLPLAVGDKVVFNKYAMAEVEVPDGDILFVAEKSILGKLE